MPRPPRQLLAKSYYHIMTRGNNRNTVFKSIKDYQYYTDLIFKYKSQHPFYLYHYCLMPNHTHFLIQTKKPADFSNFMKKLNLAYFHHYRQSYGWVGHFWQDRFKSQPVGKDEYFIQCGKYIELNPVRKGLTKDPGSYVYSSYKYYAEGEGSNLITEDFVFKNIGRTEKERQKNYQKLIIEEMIISSRTKSVWGSSYQRYHENQKRSYNLNNKSLV